MKILAKQNRGMVMINAQNTQNENNVEKIILQVPEQYEDYNKKIVFITPDGKVWDFFTNDEYVIKKAISKYEQVDFYIWLTKGEDDFRSLTKTLKFYHNEDASEEITDEEIGRVNAVVNLLEEEIAKVEDLETEIDTKIEQIDTKITDVNNAIIQTNNLNIDAEKVGETTTVTLTKKNGTTKVVHIEDGLNLEFTWQGTSLGVKTEEDTEYTFVNLQGVQGERGEQGDPFTIKKTYSSVAEMNADFNNMSLGDYVMIANSVEIADNAKLYTRGQQAWIFITDFSGATGIKGETGAVPNIQIGSVSQGSSFNVTRTGTNENPILNFTLVKGDKGETGETGATGATGATGNGIVSIEKTATSGLVDTYTITYTNGNFTTFTITNGEDGEVTLTQFNELEQRTSDLENNQIYLNTSGQNIQILDGANAFCKDVFLIGKTTQLTTTGKNLLNAPESISVRLSKSFPVKIVAHATFYVTINDFVSDASEEPEGFAFVFRNAGGTTLKNMNIIKGSNWGQNTANEDIASVIIYSNKSYNLSQGVTTIFDKVMIRPTGTSTDYEPYTGGLPSPSPDYPQEIVNCDNLINEIVSNSDNSKTQSFSFPLVSGQNFMEGDFLASDGIHHLRKKAVVSGTEIILADAKSDGIYLCNQKPSGNLTGKSIIFDEELTNATIEYELEEEFIEPYTVNQQTAYNQLQKMRTYKEETLIYSNDNLPATVNLKYVKSIDAWLVEFNDFKTRVQTLENSGGE